MSRAVTIFEFHYTIIVAKIIHNNDIIAMSLENLKNIYKIMLLVKFNFNSVYCMFCLFFCKGITLKLKICSYNVEHKESKIINCAGLFSRYYHVYY